MPSLIEEKLEQAVSILRERGIDLWLTFVRETSDFADPVLPLILDGSLTWSSALIVSGAGDRIAIVGNYEEGALRAQGVWTEVIPYIKSIRDDLLAVLRRLDPATIAINHSIDDVKSDGISHGMFLRLTEILAGTPFADRLISADGIIPMLRGRKTPTELLRIRGVLAETDAIFAETAGFINLGRSESEIAESMHRSTRDRGLGFAWDPTGCPIVNTGPHSIVGHSVPSDLRIEPGHLFHIDFGVRFEQYCSDLQRMWYIPEPGPDSSVPGPVERAFETVRRAIESAAHVLKPGAEGWVVDAAARKVIIDAGYPEYLHATGHQVGRGAHDGGALLAPKWERYGNTPLIPVEKGNVFTLELGIENVDGRGYLGLEEMVLVEQTGCTWLSNPQTTLPVIS